MSERVQALDWTVSLVVDEWPVFALARCMDAECELFKSESSLMPH
jgi:hypothetical protein